MMVPPIHLNLDAEELQPRHPAYGYAPWARGGVSPRPSRAAAATQPTPRASTAAPPSPPLCDVCAPPATPPTTLGSSAYRFINTSAQEIIDVERARQEASVRAAAAAEEGEARAAWRARSRAQRARREGRRTRQQAAPAAVRAPSPQPATVEEAVAVLARPTTEEWPVPGGRGGGEGGGRARHHPALAPIQEGGGGDPLSVAQPAAAVDGGLEGGGFRAWLRRAFTPAPGRGRPRRRRRRSPPPPPVMPQQALPPEAPDTPPPPTEEPATPRAAVEEEVEAAAPAPPHPHPHPHPPSLLVRARFPPPPAATAKPSAVFAGYEEVAVIPIGVTRPPPPSSSGGGPATPSPGAPAPAARTWHYAAPTPVGPPSFSSGPRRVPSPLPRAEYEEGIPLAADPESEATEGPPHRGGTIPTSPPPSPWPPHPVWRSEAPSHNPAAPFRPPRTVATYTPRVRHYTGPHAGQPGLGRNNSGPVPLVTSLSPVETPGGGRPTRGQSAAQAGEE